MVWNAAPPKSRFSGKLHAGRLLTASVSATVSGVLSGVFVWMSDTSAGSAQESRDAASSSVAASAED